MSDVKCSCGSNTCTVVLSTTVTAGRINLKLKWLDALGMEKYEDMSLDPNTIIQLIKQLKTNLYDLSNQ